MKSPATNAARLRAVLTSFCLAFAVSLLPPTAPADDDKPKPKPEPRPEEPAEPADAPKPESRQDKPKDKAKDKSKAKGKGNDKGKAGAPAFDGPAPDAGESAANLETRVYEVALALLAGDRRRGSGPVDPFAPAMGESASTTSARPTVQMILEEYGITFGPGASAVYRPSTFQLTVRNTPDQLELVEALVVGFEREREKQLHILFEFIEVEHEVFSDWLFDNRLDSDGTPLRRWLQDKIKAGEASIIESSLITARSGQRAKTESVYEFIYPTEYDPPEIPNEVELSDRSEAPVTGVTPTAYETRNLGTTVEVDPVIGADNTTIDLNLAPEMVALDGYTTWPNEDIDELFQQKMPTMYTMRISTQVTTIDGHYALLGSLRPREATTKGVKDPIVLGFVRADIGTVPLPKDWRAEEEPKKKK